MGTWYICMSGLCWLLLRSKSWGIFYRFLISLCHFFRSSTCSRPVAWLATLKTYIFGLFGCVIWLLKGLGIQVVAPSSSMVFITTIWLMVPYPRPWLEFPLPRSLPRPLSLPLPAQVWSLQFSNELWLASGDGAQPIGLNRWYCMSKLFYSSAM